MTTTTITTTTRPARDSGTFHIGGDLPVVRLGYGAMRITGPGIWGEPLDRDEAIRVLRRAVELGVTLIDTADSYGPYVSEEFRTAQRSAPIATVQNRYNLGDRASEPVLEFCQAEGLGFIPWFPIATGELARPRGPLESMARQVRATPGQLALAWLLRRSPVILPIPGTSSVAHQEENVAAAGVHLTDAQFEALSALPSARG